MATDSLQAVLQARPAERSQMIELLHDVQEACGYVPRDAMEAIAQRLQMPGKGGTDAAAGTDDPYPAPVPVGDLSVESFHDFFLKKRITSPSLTPNFFITERFIITSSSIRYIQSSKSTL